MARDGWEDIGTLIGWAIQHGVFIFGLGVLWSYAVGAGGVISLAVAAGVAVLVGGFIGLSVVGSRGAGQGSILMLVPIYGLIAVIGVVVWVVRLFLS